MLSRTELSHLACKIQWLPSAEGRGSRMAAAHGSRAPIRVQTRHQPPAPPQLAFQAIIYQQPSMRHAAAKKLGERQPAVLLTEEKPPQKAARA